MVNRFGVINHNHLYMPQMVFFPLEETANSVPCAGNMVCFAFYSHIILWYNTLWIFVNNKKHMSLNVHKTLFIYVLDSDNVNKIDYSFKSIFFIVFLQYIGGRKIKVK